MIDEAESQKVPEGFVLVPIETIEKVRVGLRDWELPDNRYAALDAINSDFAAAPKPEKAEPLQGLSETSEELGGYTPDFCDANCTWRDHHPECERADHSEQHLEMVEPAAQEPISYTPGRWFQARSIDEMQAKTHTEQIEWFRPADQLPDDDTTVLFIEAGEFDVFMGYLDADQWRAELHGEPIGAVAWWAHLPEGPEQ